MHPKTSLILFDIDGTLLTSGGAGESALQRGFARAFGIQDDLQAVEIAGRTDSGIARQMLSKHQLPATPENLERFFRSYLLCLQEELPQRPGRLLPGVQLLLHTLQTLPHLAIGLLTGNLERGAQLKLQHYRIHHFFAFGAFADDHHDRNELGRFAQQRATALYGTSFLPEHTFILGDTPHDIRCARAIGAKVIALATGSFSLPQLAAFEPDTLLPDLQDLDAALTSLGITHTP